MARIATGGAQKQPELDREEEELLRAATLHLVQNHGMFLVATGARPLRIRGSLAWVITVTLRYAAGHEGHVGELLYDGEEFTFLTEQSVMDERARQIAEGPEGPRQWKLWAAQKCGRGGTKVPEPPRGNGNPNVKGK